MMPYLFRSTHFRRDVASKPSKDLMQGIGAEKISQVKLIGTTIARLLDGSPDAGQEDRPDRQAGSRGCGPVEDCSTDAGPGGRRNPPLDIAGDCSSHPAGLLLCDLGRGRP